MTEGQVSAAEAADFARIADDVMRRPWSDTQGVAGIGTLREKRLHLALKTFLCEDTACHERPVADLLSGDGAPGRRMVADVLADGHIYEIQTGGFYPLRDKVGWYLTHTACRVTVVHPIPAVRYLSWIEPESGQVISRTRSPKRGRVRDVAKELYWLSDFVGDPRFSIRLLLIGLEEYRMQDGWGKDKKRGSSRYERFPTCLYGCVELATPADYALYFLPASLGDGVFTAADYARASGIRGRTTYAVIHLLEKLGLIVEDGRVGRSQGYRIVKSESTERT